MTDLNYDNRPGSVGTTQTDRPPLDSSLGLKDQAGQAASTAADEGKHVTAVAGEEVQKVAAEAMQQSKVLLEDAKTQLQEQSRAQRDKAVESLTSLGSDLERMSNQADSGLAAEFVQQAAQRVREFTSRIEGREPVELLDDVRSFARRKPGTFLLGALAVGVVAGRAARGAQKAKSDESSSPTPVAHTPATSASPVPTIAPAAPTAAPVSSWGDDTPLMPPAPMTPSAPAMPTFPPDQPGTF